MFATFPRVKDKKKKIKLMEVDNSRVLTTKLTYFRLVSRKLEDFQDRKDRSWRIWLIVDVSLIRRRPILISAMCSTCNRCRLPWILLTFARFVTTNCRRFGDIIDAWSISTVTEWQWLPRQPGRTAIYGFNLIMKLTRVP